MPSAPAIHEAPEGDRAFSPDEVLRVLGRSRDWRYRHRHELPTTRLSGGPAYLLSRAADGREIGERLGIHQTSVKLALPGHVGLRESYSRLLQAVSRSSMLWIGERHYAEARNSLPHPFLKGRSRPALFEPGHHVRVAVFTKPVEHLVDLGQSSPQPNHRNRLPEEKGLSNL